MSVTIDRMNLRILELLQEDARRTYVDIAEDMDRAESTVRDRIQRLEEFGYIQRYTTLLDTRALGMTGSALVRARVPGDHLQEAFDGLLSVPEVTNLHHTSGDRNVGILVNAADVADLERVLRRVSASANLRRVTTDVVLRSVARERPLPLRKLLGEKEDELPEVDRVEEK